MTGEADRAGREPDVDIIVVAHDSGPLLEACVSSAVAQASPERVIVVDAESTDGSVLSVAAVHPRVRIAAVRNDGFAAANNAGLEMTSGKYALLLNPDAELGPGALAALIATADARPDAAIVGARILDASGSLQAGQAGHFPSLAQVVGLRLWRAWQAITGNRALSPRGFTRTRSVDWVTGACMLVRRSAIEEAGAMDAGYFLYYEDVEWCHRMRQHGWEVLQEPTAPVVHHAGSSGGGASALGERAYRESFLRYCDQQHLWGLKAAARLGLSARSWRGPRP